MVEIERYFDLLKIPKTRDVHIIKENYYKLAKEFHPDITQLDKDVASEKLKVINDAYTHIKIWCVNDSMDVGGETIVDPQVKKAIHDFYFTYKILIKKAMNGLSQRTINNQLLEELKKAKSFLGTGNLNVEKGVFSLLEFFVKVANYPYYIQNFERETKPLHSEDPYGAFSFEYKTVTYEERKAYRIYSKLLNQVHDVFDLIFMKKIHSKQGYYIAFDLLSDKILVNHSILKEGYDTTPYYAYSSEMVQQLLAVKQNLHVLFLFNKDFI